MGFQKCFFAAEETLRRAARAPNSKTRTALQNKTYLYIESKQLFQV